MTERIGRELRALALHDGTRIDATFGVAVYPDHGTTTADLLRSADRRLYLAKQARKPRTADLPADAA